VRTWARWLPVFACALALGGCNSQSVLSPHSPASSDIRTLWWWMLAVASIVFGGAVVMLVLAWIRRGRPGLPFFGRNERATSALVICFGIVIPSVVLIALFAVSDLYVINTTQAPAAGSTAMTIRVVGHQWWWEVRYPGTRAVTANEIHIPVDTRVRVVATTADVIHSFWVPELNRKIDMINGRDNETLLYADQAGVYRGQCAEFCGLQHAHMAMRVFAQPRSAFRSWLKREAQPARKATTPAEQTGQREFMSSQCASCHTIRGTAASGTVGPDLTHVASRTTLAADTIPNGRFWLKRWIRNPQRVKPGNEMPRLKLGSRELTEIAAYLGSLR
jgi:cytochrome c oxidase subunit II